MRAGDCLVEDLGLDPEDLEMDIVSDVSRRTGRSLMNCKTNPLYGRVKTVGDLVEFFCAQERQQLDQRL